MSVLMALLAFGPRQTIVIEGDLEGITRIVVRPDGLVELHTPSGVYEVKGNGSVTYRASWEIRYVCRGTSATRLDIHAGGQWIPARSASWTCTAR